MSCHDGEPHLDGEFRAWDFTWDTSYLPVTMYYNPSNEPVSYTPPPVSISQLAEIAYELWEDDTSFFTIQNADPQTFVTSEGWVDNNKSVILWEDLEDMSVVGEARMYPNTEEKIYDCQTLGRESNRAVDIVLNPEISKTWLFQENPPSQTYADFVGVLAHELGHGMGLAHVDITNSMMYPAPEAQGSRGFTEGDRAGRTYQHTISNLSGTIPYSMVLSASTDNFTIDGDLIVPESEILDITDSKTLTFSTPDELTIDGEVNIGNNFTLQDGAIEVGQTGRLEFLGDADLRFKELASQPPFFVTPYFRIRGDIDFSPTHTVQMHLSAGASAPSWEGITIYGSASGTLQNIDIEDAAIGIYLSSSDDISLEDINIMAPANAGITSSSSDFTADNIFITGSGSHAIEVSGGNPDFDYFDLDDPSGSGFRVSQFATTTVAEGNVEGADGGSGNAGVWIDNASHTHINGTIGSNSGWDVGAVNNAWGWFNGTSWDGSQPFTYVDGSSTLNIQNPNNPQKAVTQLQTTAGSLNPTGNKESVPELQELLRDWSERYRQDPVQAVDWLKSEASAMSMDLKSVANILLMDYHLSKSNFETVNDLIANTVRENNTYLIPGTIALRQL